MSRSEPPPHAPGPVQDNATRGTVAQAAAPQLCRCGHARDHYSVSAEAEYSAWGWFCNLFGITAHPRRLHFRCRQCDEVFDTTDNPEELKGHV